MRIKLIQKINIWTSQLAILWRLIQRLWKWSRYEWKNFEQKNSKSEKNVKHKNWDAKIELSDGFKFDFSVWSSISCYNFIKWMAKNLNVVTFYNIFLHFSLDQNTYIDSAVSADFFTVHSLLRPAVKITGIWKMENQKLKILRIWIWRECNNDQ